MKDFLFRFLFLCFAFACTSHVNAQQAQTPEVASIAKYIDFPAANFTGIISENIPIYEISMNGLSMPISLNYHARGIQVNEIASNVGQGWNLNAGGVITRVVRGLPDDFNKDQKSFMFEQSNHGPRVGMFWHTKADKIRNFDTNLVIGEYKYDFTYNLLDILVPFNVARYYGYALGFPILYGENDTEYDIFYINCNGIEGQFMFEAYSRGDNRDIKLMPYQDITINHTVNANGDISAFTVKDYKGNKYYFDIIEKVHSYSMNELDSHCNDLYYNSSWYLSKVEAANKETIYFSYDSEKFFTYSNSEIMIRDENLMPRYQYRYLYPRTNYHYDYGKNRLRKIETKNEIIQFIPAKEIRKDIEPDYSNSDYNKIYTIEKIEITTKENKKIKSYQLNYSYFNKQSSLHSEKRLKLESLHELGSGYYKFHYDERYPIPKLKAKGQDVWGYYNGANNNCLIPTIYYYPSLSLKERYNYLDLGINFDPQREVYHAGANRNPNSTYATLGMLTKIEYPTGGYVEYEYESNQFDYMNRKWNGGGVRIKSIRKYNRLSEQIPLLERHYSYSAGKLINFPLLARPWQLSKNSIYISATPANSLGVAQGGFVIYPQVTINENGNNKSNGKTTYTYSCPATYEVLTDKKEGGLYSASEVYYCSYGYPKNKYRDFEGANIYPFPPNPNYDFNRGLLLNETIFDNTNNIVKTIDYNYDFYYAGGKTKPHSIYSIKLHMDPFFDSYGLENPLESYFFSKYENLTDVTKVLTKKTERVYGNKSSAPILEETTYTYSPNHLNPIKERKSGNNPNEFIIKKCKYALDYYEIDDNLEGMGFLYNHNINFPIETSFHIQKEDKEYLLSAEIQHYSNTMYPYSTLSLQPDFPILDFKPSNATGLDGNILRFDKRYKQDARIEYDRYGNPVSIFNSKASISTVYLWGYNNQYPIAEIKNANYDTVELELGGKSEIERISNSIILTDVDRKKINALRNKAKLKGTLITTYTYKPLVGIETITDMRGIITTYEYDNFGRLKWIKDHEGRIFKSHGYHYYKQ